MNRWKYRCGGTCPNAPQCPHASDGMSRVLYGVTSCWRIYRQKQSLRPVSLQCWPWWVIRVDALLASPGRLRANMAPSTKNRKYITYRNAAEEGPSHGRRRHAQNFGKVWNFGHLVFAICKQTGRQTDRQTDTRIRSSHYSALLPRGRSKKSTFSSYLRSMRSYRGLIDTPWVNKKQDTKLLPITSPNVNRFSKFFQR